MEIGRFICVVVRGCKISFVSFIRSKEVFFMMICGSIVFFGINNDENDINMSIRYCSEIGNRIIYL